MIQKTRRVAEFIRGKVELQRQTVWKAANQEAPFTFLGTDWLKSEIKETVDASFCG